MKTCSKCHVAKPLTAFQVDRKNKDGLRTECRECRSASMANPVTRSKQAVGYSRYKIRQSGVDVKDTLTSHDVAMVLNEGSCNYCQRELDYSEATVDHVIPFSRGGSNSYQNVVCACKGCNSSKGEKPAILHMIQSCEPYATKKLLERLALRKGVSTEEIYAGLVTDAQTYFAEQAVILT